MSIPLKNPKISPKLLSIDPNPVHVTARPSDFPKTIIEKSEKMKIKIPKPILFINSDSTYSVTQGCNFGTKIIVVKSEITHFINEIKLKEKPFKKH